MTSVSEAITLVEELVPAWQREQRKLKRIDKWARWDHDVPHKPKKATAEHRELAARAQAPWGDLVVKSIAQTLYVEGYRRPDAPDDATGWTIWQANGMDAEQVRIHYDVLKFGVAYGRCLPGKTLTGAPMPTMQGVSPLDLLAAYEDPAHDDWPVYALSVSKIRGGFKIMLLDDAQEFTVKVSSIGERLRSENFAVADHNAGVCPIVRYKNRFDLVGRVAGEIEPFIPLLGKIDQTSYDRLIVQRFGAWLVRYIAGMDVIESATATGQSVDDVKIKLAIEDFLTAKDPDTKFGALPATPLDGFIKAHEADLHELAAVSQTPAFELLGEMSNLSAEALAAAKASQTAKSEECKHSFGESHEQFIRLGCHIAGDTDGANDFMAQVRWADTSIRSIAQAVDALGKMATMLGFPPELLWRKVPGVTDQDVSEAKAKLAEEGGFDTLLARLEQMANAPAPAPGPAPPPKA